jgi:PiT family inorganic phosphate transporter
MIANGWTDAPLSIAAAVKTKSLKFKTAVILAAVCNLLGGLFMVALGNGVAVSIYKISGVDAGENLSEVLTSGVLTVVVWSVVTYFFSVPTSESHALISALFGAVAFAKGFYAFKNPEWIKVISGLILSTLPSLLLAKAVSKLLHKSPKLKNSRSVFLKLQVLGAAVSSFAHGAQDGQKFAGILALSCMAGKSNEVSVPFWAILISSLFISSGTLLGGRKIVGTLGAVASGEPLSGFSADISSGFLLLLLSAFGFPVSTTHSKSFAMLGADGNFSKEFIKMLFAWGLTFPACISLGYIFRYLLNLL